jgi:hypothetical protein
MMYSMRLASLALLGLLAFQSASPQKVAIQPPTLGDAERAYREAQQEWLNADPNLAADLFKGNPQEMHKRIQRTAALRDQMMEKKAVYLDLVVKHFDETRARLSSAKSAQLPIPELRQNLEDEQSRVLGEMDRLDGLIHDLPQDDLYALVAHELNAERTQLVNLQVSLAQQIRAVNVIGDDTDAANKLGANLEKQLESISVLWEQERDGTKAQREHWKALYDAMNRAVDGGKTPAAPRTPDAPAGKPDAAPKTAPPNTGPVKPGNLNGIWNYQSSPNGWTGFGEPVRVALELHYAGSTIIGSYLARIPGRRDIRDLNLALSGQEVSPGKAVLLWVSETPPARGEMVVQLGGDRRVLVERTKSSDTYFPAGMEVLEPR